MEFNHNIPIKKSWGQNFLIDNNIIHKIIKSIAPNKNDYILEIGSGRGALTQYLYNNIKELTVIEIDPLLVKEIKEKNYPNTTVIHGDILKWEPKNKKKQLKIVGNLPYNISSPIIFKFLASDYWNDMIIMVQKELGDRIISKHNTKNYSRISVMAQTFCDVKRIFNISKNVFYPIPKVDSSLLKFSQKNINIDLIDFSNLIKSAFRQRRKKLKNNLPNLDNIKDLTKFSNLRAEQISIKDYLEIYKNYIF